jgi:spore coat polysaccharide biosynthesis protein SpsF
MTPEAAGRLEQLWAGDFGDAYVDRNFDAQRGRRAFWDDLLDRIEVASALEVGCNVGANLAWIAQRLPRGRVAGVDVNERALAELRRRLPGVRAERACARRLPAADGEFDLTFTMGVLIHQDPSELGDVMSEIVRCSRRYVLCGEYHADRLTEVPYRGRPGSLFKQDFGALYARSFPQLRLLDRGHLSEPGVWDDVTWWLFERDGGAAA